MGALICWPACLLISGTNWKRPLQLSAVDALALGILLNSGFLLLFPGGAEHPNKAVIRRAAISSPLRPDVRLFWPFLTTPVYAINDIAWCHS